MAGHSKFKNIMHRKGAQDAKRAKVFAKHAREIYVAAKSGLPDPEQNARLRNAIIAARAVNTPKDNIERAIKKAAGGGEESYDEIRYEGYGPGGIAFIVEALTDNKNRTAAEVRSAFTKGGGSLGETGSVGFMFERVGEIQYPADKADADTMFEQALEAGAQDVESSDDDHVITCEPDDFAAVRDALIEQFGDPSSAQFEWKPNTLTEVDEDTAGKVLRLIDALEDNDDVQNVSTNVDISDEIAAKLG